MEVLVNQLGYDPAAPKRTVVRAPGDVDLAGFTVRETDGSVAAEGQLSFVGHVPDWRDWTFWTGTFDDLTRPGEYVVAVEGPDGPAQSRRFRVDERVHQERLVSDLLVHFTSRRCRGRFEEADRRVPFVGDRGDRVDVRGGWYDASGDVSKYLSHLSYANYWNPQQIPLVAWGLADAFERLVERDHPLGRELAEEFLAEAIHGADFLVRMQDREGYFYQTVFDGWSGDPRRREICAFEGFDGEKTDDYEAGYRQGGGLAIAALARASRLSVPDRADPTLSVRDLAAEDPSVYRTTAVTAFDHLEANNEAYLDDGTENVIDDYCALLAATELSAATGLNRFRDAATERARSLVDRQTDDGTRRGWFRADEDGERPFFHAADEGLPIVALRRYLDVHPDADARDAVRRSIRQYWRFELKLTDDVTNPFGYARQYVRGTDDDAPRDAFFTPHENETGYWWQGENARIASLATAALRSRDLAPDRLADAMTRFAHAQLDWILGLNPFDVSMVRGVGAPGPEYHREMRNGPGGVLNGITGGVDDPDDIAFCPSGYADDHADRWRWAEQWLPHAAWLLLAICSADRL